MVVLSTSAIPSIRMTVDEYLSADLPEGTRYELVDGEIAMVPVPGIPHDWVLTRLVESFAAYKESHPGVIGYLTTRAAVTLSDRETAREPDLAVYAPGSSPRVGESWKDVLPVLVVEIVSFGPDQRDYEEKRVDFWDAGVPEYWIVDPQRRTLTALSRGPDGWVESVFDDRATLRPAAFPGFELNLAQLFATGTPR